MWKIAPVTMQYRFQLKTIVTYLGSRSLATLLHLRIVVSVIKMASPYWPVSSVDVRLASSIILLQI